MAQPAKNTICLWYNGDAEEAARFYARTFPDSSVTAVHRAPGDYPAGKKGDVLTVEFTVMGIPCLGLNGGARFPAYSSLFISGGHRRPGRNRSLLERDYRQWRRSERLRLVQGQMGPLLADHSDRSVKSRHQS